MKKINEGVDYRLKETRDHFAIELKANQIELQSKLEDLCKKYFEKANEELYQKIIDQRKELLATIKNVEEKISDDVVSKLDSHFDKTIASLNDWERKNERRLLLLKAATEKKFIDVNREFKEFLHQYEDYKLETNKNFDEVLNEVKVKVKEIEEECTLYVLFPFILD